MKNGLELIELTNQKNIPGNNAPGTGYYELPGGYRYHTCFKRFGLPAGKVASEVFDFFQLRVGSKLSRQLQPNLWDDLLSLDNPRYGLQGNVPGGNLYVPFQFTEVDRETGAAKTNYALDVVEGQTVRIETVFKANAAQPTLTRAFAMVEPLSQIPRDLWNVTPDGKPVIAKYTQTSLSPGGSDFDLDTDVEALDEGRLISLTLYDPATTGNIARTVLKIDGADKWDRYKADNDVELAYHGFTVRAGEMTLITDLLDKQSDAWNLGAKKSLKLKIYSDAAMTGGMKAVAKVWGAAE
jgi:hypothetical protein